MKTFKITLTFCVLLQSAAGWAFQKQPPKKKPKYPKLEKLLAEKYKRSKQKLSEGIWFFAPKIADIQKFERPLVTKYLSNYAVYKLKLTHVLDHHITRDLECVLVHEPKTDSLRLFPPAWFDSGSIEFLGFVYDQDLKFKNRKVFQLFIREVLVLLINEKESYDHKVFGKGEYKFDLMHQRPSGKKIIWRKVWVGFKKKRIWGIWILNPATNNYRTVRE